MAKVPDTGEDQFLSWQREQRDYRLGGNLLCAHLCILHILGRLDPFNFISNSVDRIDQGPNVPRNIVKQVNGGHGCEV